ncbi:mechanosensitive ion channel protein MscS [Steroidobacter denitrificans]|uniref:Mechanosensing system component YbdG n=1 Tax=Steroidobacter denitrificans TaxID=465721 RepID=A0A127F642_STEDE|nr:mechanosensitive ion channel domain-containing protein [Steroidobacter denitrificans]AMN45914.1 mechanosensitive ion channel protein MscS [Steroidobacter denitrificans]
MDSIRSALAPLQGYPWMMTMLQLTALVLVVWLAGLLTRLLLVRTIGQAVRMTPTRWDDALLGKGVISRLANVVPALVVYYGVGIVADLPAAVASVVRGVAGAFVVVTIALSLGKLLDAVGELYAQRDEERAKARPIKGYLQLLKIIIYLVTAILVIATLFDRDPLLLLSGLGAMTAVLLLVFKDTLMSLVASVQLASHDMLRVGDWIEMPQLNADGYAIDISLHTVKVQNWDRTITTIPTWRLISESFKNWRGMFESGGRRIKRSLYLDQTSVRFLDEREREELQRFALIDAYLDRKHQELEEFNSKLLAEGKDPINTRRVTNIGTFRAYVQAYLEAHSGINAEMLLLVRQLQPGPTGLPLEIYCFTASTAWVVHEAVQADIFDHLYAILPRFGLRVFQQPSGEDVSRALKAGEAPAARPTPAV